MRGSAGGVVSGCQALKWVHPDHRLRLPVINEPLRCRPVLLSVFLHTPNPSRVPVLRQALGVPLGGLDGAHRPAGAPGRGVGRHAMDDIIHGARAGPQHRVAGQEVGGGTW